MNKRWMLARMIAAAVLRRKLRIAIAFAAIVIGAAIISGLAGIYYDIGQKMGRELRAYGANLVITPVSPETRPYINLEEVSRAAAMIDGERLLGYVPYLYGVVRVRDQEIVSVGTRLEQLTRVFPAWKIAVSGATEQPESGVIVGDKVAGRLGINPGDHLALTGAVTGRTVEIPVSGILVTGAGEDNQLFMDIEVVATLLDRPGVASLAYFSVLGNSGELESLASRMQREYGGISVKPIRQVSRSEGLILEKIKGLVFLAVAVVLLLTSLCVGITMMNTVMERRREIGLRKALGAQYRDIMTELLAEAALLGLGGGLVGWGLGLLLSQALSRSVFQAALAFRWEILPLTVALAMGLVIAASIVPARAAASVPPATTLRGE